VSALHPPDINESERNMEPGTSGHRRRRSSLMNPVDAHPSSGKPKSKKSPGAAPVTGIPEDGTAEEIAEESTSEDMELGELSDDDLQVDEETGLTAKDKKRRGKRRRKNTLLDQRIVGDVVGGITEEEKKEADQYVVKNLLVNGILIGLWYLFSLSISIVGFLLLSSSQSCFESYANSRISSITNGCSHPLT
jgi:solute carrier family 35 protein C2